MNSDEDVSDNESRERATPEGRFPGLTAVRNQPTDQVDQKLVTDGVMAYRQNIDHRTTRGIWVKNKRETRTVIDAVPTAPSMSVTRTVMV